MAHQLTMKLKRDEKF